LRSLFKLYDFQSRCIEAVQVLCEIDVNEGLEYFCAHNLWSHFISKSSDGFFFFSSFLFLFLSFFLFFSNPLFQLTDLQEDIQDLNIDDKNSKLAWIASSDLSMRSLQQKQSLMKHLITSNWEVVLQNLIKFPVPFFSSFYKIKKQAI